MQNAYKFILLGALTFLLFSCGGGDENGADSRAEANVATPDELFSTVLADDTEGLRSYIKRGVDLSVLDGSEGTLLHVGAECGATSSSKLLIDAGLDVDAQNAKGETPLMLATRNKHLDTIRMLLRHNATSDIVDNTGYRALTIAAEFGDADLVEALALYSRNHLDDALFIAALQGHSELIDTLTNYGASVYSRLDVNGRTPLMMAAQNGHLECVRILLENGANRYSTDEEGLTASEIARTAGHEEIALYLGAKPEEEEFAFKEDNMKLIEEAATQVVEQEKQKIEALVQEVAELQEMAPEAPATPVTESVETTPVVPAPVKPVAPVAELKKVEKEVPLAEKQLEVIDLNGYELVSAPSKPVAESILFKTYREESLPIKVASVLPEVVSIKYLYGDHETKEIKLGEMIPDTNLKVVSAKVKRDYSKMSAGKPADVSVVMIEDQTTGKRRKMTTGLNIGKTEPFAMVKEYEGKALLVAKKGDRFRQADGRVYEVLEVRSTQLLFQDVESGEVHTVFK